MVKMFPIPHKKHSVSDHINIGSNRWYNKKGKIYSLTLENFKKN